MDRRRRGGRPARLGAEGVPRLRAGASAPRHRHRRYPWIEIDFPEDYRRAVREVLPAIDDGTPLTRRPMPARVCDARPFRACSRSRPDPSSSPAQRPRVVAHRRRHGPAERAARPAPAAVPRRGDATRRGIGSSRSSRRPTMAAAPGRLRAEFNMIPPGDIRNCLAALSENDVRASPTSSSTGSTPATGSNGHAIGNLLLAALADVTRDFAQAVDIAARILDICGVVLPATSEMVTLVAEFTRRPRAERRDDDRPGRRDDRAARPAAGAAAPARRASATRCAAPTSSSPAPGSLYTSILPPLLVPDIARRDLGIARRAASWSRTSMTEAGETDDFSVLDHLLTIERHLGRQLFDCVIYNTTPVPEPLAAGYAASGLEADRHRHVRIERAASVRRARHRRAAGVGASGRQDPAPPGAAGVGDHGARAGQARRLRGARRGRRRLDVRAVLSASRAPVRAQSRSGIPVSEPGAPGGARLPPLRHREPRRVHRHHRRDRIGQDHAAADAAAQSRQPDDGRRGSSTRCSSRASCSSRS